MWLFRVLYTNVGLCRVMYGYIGLGIVIYDYVGLRKVMYGYVALYMVNACVAMEVGCSRIWGLTPTTQTQVGGTPHKPALPATQP